MDCVRLHPAVDLEDSLANNIAVLKLGNTSNFEPETVLLKQNKPLAIVVDPRTADAEPRRANAVSDLLEELELEATGCCFDLSTLTDCSGSRRSAGAEDRGLPCPQAVPQHHLPAPGPGAVQESLRELFRGRLGPRPGTQGRPEGRLSATGDHGAVRAETQAGVC